MPDPTREDDEVIAAAKALGFNFKAGADFMLSAFEAEFYGSGGFLADGTLELHTGGWSGCEAIIEAARESKWWLRWWYSERRGGHFIFGNPK